MVHSAQEHSPTPEDPEDTVAAINWAAYERSSSAGHMTDYVKLAQRCNDFYIGEQWDSSDKAKLDAEGRPALTINMVLSTINAMLGEHEGQRADIVFKPRRDTNQAVADVMTKLVMQILHNNDFAYVENEVLADGGIEDRGYYDIRMDFSDHISGEIRITNKDPKTILPDPNAQTYDPAGWNEVIETQWMTLDDVAIHYGQSKSKKLENIAAGEGGDDGLFGTDSVVFTDNKFGTNDGLFQSNPGISDDRDRHVAKIRVINRQYRKLAMISYFVDNDTGDERPVPEGWEDDKVKQFARKWDMSVIRKLQKKIRWTVSAGNITLHDSWSPYRAFTIVPFFPYYRRGKPFGIVRNLLSPQEQLNKVTSQELHIINTTANSGWVADEASLTNMTTQDLEERGAETGLVLITKAGANRPEKIQPNSIPSGIDKVKHDTLASIREISAINKSMLGFDREDVSGIAKQQNRLAGQTSLRVPFSNLNRSREILAKRILELVQDFYTETRVIQVTNWEKPDRVAETVEINGISAEGELINDVTVGEYDIVASSAPHRDSFMESQFAEVIAMREAGVAIPDDVVIENSHLARKVEIAKRVREMLGQGEKSPEQLQIEQLQQQAAIQAMLLQLQKTQSEIQKLQAEGALMMAKARDTEGRLTAEGEQFAIEMQAKASALIAAQEQAIMEMQTKLILADKHIVSGQQELLFKESANSAREAAKIAAQRGQGLGRFTAK